MGWHPWGRRKEVLRVEGRSCVPPPYPDTRYYPAVMEKEPCAVLWCCYSSPTALMPSESSCSGSGSKSPQISRHRQAGGRLWLWVE